MRALIGNEHYKITKKTGKIMRIFIGQGWYQIWFSGCGIGRLVPFQSGSLHTVKKTVDGYCQYP